MSFLIKGGKDFVPAPDGVHNAVCVDVVDLGLVDKVWKGKVGRVHMLRIVWEIEAKMESGKPFLASNRYTVSLSPKANLRKILKTWRGRDFTPEELVAFDIETIVGAPAQLVIVHDTKDDRTYANINSVIKAAVKIQPCGGYQRVKDRPGYKAPEMHEEHKIENQHDAADSSDDDNCPF